MNREILFRGKRKDDGEWIEGFFVRQKEKCYIGANPYQLMDGYSSKNGQHYGFGDFYEVDPETVCRYTGIDKGDRKIFEGYIVRDILNDSVIGVVKYGEYRNPFNDDKFGGHVGFYVDWKEKKELLRKDLMYWVKNSEFIGNIFDNPELIKE